MDGTYVLAALILASVLASLPDIYRLLNNYILSRIFHFRKIEDTNYAIGYMVQFTCMLVLALFFLIVGG